MKSSFFLFCCSCWVFSRAIGPEQSAIADKKVNCIPCHLFCRLFSTCASRKLKLSRSYRPTGNPKNFRRPWTTRHVHSRNPKALSTATQWIARWLRRRPLVASSYRSASTAWTSRTRCCALSSTRIKFEWSSCRRRTRRCDKHRSTSWVSRNFPRSWRDVFSSSPL